MLGYQRAQQEEFWINTFLKIADHLNIDYDSVRAKEVVEFFYILKEFERKTKPEGDG